MITPFNDKFQFQSIDVTLSIIQRGYIIFQFIPDLSTVSVDLDGGNVILSDAYIVEEVTESNSFLYPDAEIGSYILTWNYPVSASSSSSSSSSQLELKILLESGNYSLFHVRYVASS